VKEVLNSDKSGKEFVFWSIPWGDKMIWRSWRCIYS
jgi:hypothetical protein